MKVTLTEYALLSPDDRAKVTHLVAETEADLWSRLVTDRGYADLTVKPGAGMDDRGFNR